MNNNTLTTKIERAISELRRGGKLVISDNNSGISVLLVASEMIQKNTVEEMSSLSFSRPNIILSENRCRAIGIKNANGPHSILINNNWSIEDILSLCMPLTNHRIPTIDGVLPESDDGIVSSCIFIFRCVCKGIIR